MAYESVGPGYSSGILPNYAEEYYQTQQNQSHKFDNYTNPFLLARNISSVFQPGIENAQKQQQVGISQQMEQIDAARQQMAQTAQNTLLPLQASQIQAQTAGLQAEGAMRQFQLGKSQDAYSQAPDYFNSLSSGVNSGDPSAIYSAMAQNPAAAMTYGQESGNALAYADRVSQTRMAGVVGSAQQQGADAAAKNGNMNPDDYASSLSPQPGENDAQFQQRKAAAMQGFAQKQQQMQGIQAQAMNQQVLAKIRSGATITAAELRALGQGVRTGQVTVDQLEQLSPGLGNAALNSPNQDFTPNPNATAAPVSRYPEQIQTEALKHYNTVSENPAATPQMKDEAARQLAVVNPGLAPSLGVAVQYDPVTQAQLDGINAQEMAAKATIKQAGSDPSLTKAPSWYDNAFLPADQKDTTPLQRAIGQVQNLELQRAKILKQQTAGAQVTPAAVSAPSGAKEASPQSTPTIQFSPDDMQKLPPQYQQALKWAESNPTDPRSKQIVQQAQMLLSRQ